MLPSDFLDDRALTPSTLSSSIGQGVMRGINMGFGVSYNGGRSIWFPYSPPLQDIMLVSLVLYDFHCIMSFVFIGNDPADSLGSSEAPSIGKIPKTRECMRVRRERGSFQLYGRHWDNDSNDNSTNNPLLHFSNKISVMECYIFDIRGDLLDLHLR